MRISRLAVVRRLGDIAFRISDRLLGQRERHAARQPLAVLEKVDTRRGRWSLRQSECWICPVYYAGGNHLISEIISGGDGGGRRRSNVDLGGNAQVDGFASGEAI